MFTETQKDALRELGIKHITPSMSQLMKHGDIGIVRQEISEVIDNTKKFNFIKTIGLSFSILANNTPTINSRADGDTNHLYIESFIKNPDKYKNAQLYIAHNIEEIDSSFIFTYQYSWESHNDILTLVGKGRLGIKWKDLTIKKQRLQ